MGARRVRAYQSVQDCDTCQGHRLKPEALAVKIAGVHISEIAEMSIDEAVGWFGSLSATLPPKQPGDRRSILKEINERLGFLSNVGLEYLTLVARLGHPLGRREPAHPARLADRHRG